MEEFLLIMVLTESWMCAGWRIYCLLWHCWYRKFLDIIKYMNQIFVPWLFRAWIIDITCFEHEIYPSVLKKWPSRITMAVMKKLDGKICRLELENVKWAEEFPRCAEMMRNAWWFSLCEKFRGHNLEVTNAFVNNYKDFVVNFQTLNFRVNEATVAEATSMSPERERWFKKHLFEVDLSMFLLPGFEKLDWGKGIHLNNVNP